MARRFDPLLPPWFKFPLGATQFVTHYGDVTFPPGSGGLGATGSPIFFKEGGAQAGANKVPDGHRALILDAHCTAYNFFDDVVFSVNNLRWRIEVGGKRVLPDMAIEGQVAAYDYTALNSGGLVHAEQRLEHRCTPLLVPLIVEAGQGAQFFVFESPGATGESFSFQAWVTGIVFPVPIDVPGARGLFTEGE